MQLVFTAVEEAAPGPKWASLAERHWPAYRHWYVSEGLEARATYAVCLRQLRRHMPELVPTYERLCALAGGSDLAARFLSLYRPPAYLSGCSQVAWSGAEPLLVRNYDYAPALCEGLVLKSRWNGRWVLAMVDCLWGVLDGLNQSGLAVSLTFGGRRVVGDGFGVPVILRYVLEFCETVGEAVEALARIPCHMAYNVTLIDREGTFRTVFLAPDRKPAVRQVAIATNHQGRIDWHDYARATATLERERFLFFRLQDDAMTADRLIGQFLESPLYTTAFATGFGTLYTAVYAPARGEVRFLWPAAEWRQSIGAFDEGIRVQSYGPPAGLSAGF